MGLAYLPTFIIKINQMLVNTSYMDPMGKEHSWNNKKHQVATKLSKSLKSQSPGLFWWLYKGLRLYTPGRFSLNVSVFRN